MGDYWTNFAKFKDPNGDGLPQWPGFEPGLAQELALGHNTTEARAVDRKALYEGMRAQQAARLVTVAKVTSGAR